MESQRRPAYSSLQSHVPASPDVSVYIRPSVTAEGWWWSHVSNKKILLVLLSRLIHATWKKKLLRNMIAPVKRTNYSPLTSFKTRFYWPIQPNKTLLHERKGTPSFLHSFSKPSIYMVLVITPQWHLNFIEQDFKICRQYIKDWRIYFFQMGRESPNGLDRIGAKRNGFTGSNSFEKKENYMKRDACF